MSSKQNIIQYEVCIMCNRNLAKLGSNNCKKCKIEFLRNRTDNEVSYKMYYYKFYNRSNKSKLKLNSSKSDIGYSLCTEPSSSLTYRPSTIKNSDLFLLQTWNQFRSLKEFTTCIIESDQITISYFIVPCSTFVQSLPKFQYFIKSKAIDLRPESLYNIAVLPFPLTRPLQLLYQQSFWDELLLLYFREFHPMNPLFSIQSFDRKTVSPTLLNAMYYCAYLFSKNRPNEITEYIGKLAEQNIKKIVRNATIDNIRALIIHTMLAQWGGNLTLAKSLQAHLSRMCYLFGLHMNNNKLSQVDRYNRSILFCMARICNIRMSSSHNFAPSYLTDYRKSDPYLYDKKWQLPRLGSMIYSENEMENELYSDRSTLIFKFVNIATDTIWFPLFSKLEANRFDKVWARKIEKLNNLYKTTAQTLNDLIDKCCLFKSTMALFELHLKTTYHEAIIEMYELLKHRNKILQPSEISIILDHCHDLYHVLFFAENYSPYFQYYAHFIGLNYLNIYPKCSSSEKQRTKQRLLDLLIFMRDKFQSYFSLNYLVLKTGYESLDEK